MSYVHGSSEEADHLRDELLKEAKQLGTACVQMRGNLSKLSASCRDGSYTRMEYYTNETIKRVSAAAPSITLVCRKLSEYSAFLQKNTGGTAAAGGTGLSGAKTGIPAPSLKPDRKTPRDLAVTQYSFTQKPGGEMVYDSPMELAAYLYAKQGTADPKFGGTCGLCSCANILRMAGVLLGEKEMIDYASVTPDGEGSSKMLCAVYPGDRNASGGTSPENRKAILEHFGISSKLVPVEMDNGSGASDKTINELANYVSEGRGVIVSVHAKMLYKGLQTSGDLHAVTVTSVMKDKDGNVLGFYIADSNVGRGTTFYPLSLLRKSFSGSDMNVTHSIIR